MYRVPQGSIEQQREAMARAFGYQYQPLDNMPQIRLQQGQMGPLAGSTANIHGSENRDIYSQVDPRYFQNQVSKSTPLPQPYSQMAPPQQQQSEGQSPANQLASTAASKLVNYGAKKLISGGSSAATTAGSTAGSGAGAGSAVGTTTVGNVPPTAGSGLWGSLQGSYVGPAVGAAGLAYVGTKWGKNRARNAKTIGRRTMQGAASGAAMGSYFGPWGAGIGAVAGGLYGLAASTVKSGKHKDQYARDEARGVLKAGGLIDDKYNLTLADGRKYDIGVDGGKRPYQVDMKKEGAGDAIANTMGLAQLVLPGMSAKQKEDMTGYFANATLSGGDMNANARALYQQAGFDRDSANAQIGHLAGQGVIDHHTARVMQGSINRVFGTQDQKQNNNRRSGNSGRRR